MGRKESNQTNKQTKVLLHTVVHVGQYTCKHDKETIWAYHEYFLSYPSVITYVMGAQKNCLFETVLSSTQNICFGWGIRKIIFNYTYVVIISKKNSVKLWFFSYPSVLSGADPGFLERGFIWLKVWGG